MPEVLTRNVAEMTAHELGAFGEELACNFVTRRGWRLVERNWQTPYGEADIVALDEFETPLFIEVKTRLALGEDASVMPELAIDAAKKKRYADIINYFLQLYPDINYARFASIAIAVVGDHLAHLRYYAEVDE